MSLPSTAASLSIPASTTAVTPSIVTASMLPPGVAPVMPICGSLRVHAQVGPGLKARSVQASPVSASLVSTPWIVTVPVADRRPGVAIRSSMPTRRTGPVMATVRPSISVVMGTTTRWPLAAKPAVPPSMRCSRPPPSMTSASTVSPVQSSGMGVWSIDFSAVASAVSRTTLSRRGSPRSGTASLAGRAALSFASVPGVACPSASGGNVRIRDAPSGSTEISGPLTTTRPTSTVSATALVTAVTPSTDAYEGATAQLGVVGYAGATTRRSPPA